MRSADTHSSTLPRELWPACRRLALPAAAVAVGMVLLGLLLTNLLSDGGLGGEAGINRELARDRTPGLNTATQVLTYLADTPTIVALTALGALACRLWFRRWRESVYLVLCVGIETVIFLLTSIVIDRNRPPVPKLDDAPPTSSFPSGHTAAAVCFYGGVAAIMLWHNRHTVGRVVSVALAVAVPLMVGASRLYRGMHFTTDVVAGLLLGVTWLALCTWLVLTRLTDSPTTDSRESDSSATGVTAPAHRHR
jgi:membrane-associated phospholipid phosphatase